MAAPASIPCQTRSWKVTLISWGIVIVIPRLLITRLDPRRGPADFLQERVAWATFVNKGRLFEWIPSAELVRKVGRHVEKRPLMQLHSVKALCFTGVRLLHSPVKRNASCQVSMPASMSVSLQKTNDFNLPVTRLTVTGELSYKEDS